jgi:hypothetical protein
MIVLAGSVAAWLALAPPSEPERTANPHFDPARAAFEAEDWDTAAREFEAAYAHDGRLEYLYAQAQAERLGGHCAQAVESYRRFIAAQPPEAAIEDANENIAKCDPAKPRPPPPRVTAAPTPKEAAPVDRDGARPRPWYRDPWGGVLAFGGIAVGATGGALIGIAHDRERDAARAEDEQGYRDAIAGAPTMSRVGIGLLSAGAALLVAGIVRWSWVAAARRRRAR